MPPVELSAREARRVQLAAQGLLGKRLTGGPSAVLERTRGVQLDTISVLARSHELVALARIGRTSPKRIEAAWWGGPPYRAFEYWYHAACILPIEEWPNLEFKRCERRERGFRWHHVDDLDTYCETVKSELAERGPLTANELGGAKRGGPWWDWSETKIAAEWLLDIGEVICTTRRGFQRVYDLPERVLPPELLGVEVPRADAILALARRAAAALGVATAGDLAAYIGVKRPEMRSLMGALGLEAATVEGWRDEAVLGAGATEHPALAGPSRARPVMLSPFDSLICDRSRLARIFGVDHRLEAYVPKTKRVHGYYSMPVLAGERIIGKVDPKRDGRTLVARSVHLEPGIPPGPAARAIASALRQAAGWIGADGVAVEVCPDDRLRSGLLASLGS